MNNWCGLCTIINVEEGEKLFYTDRLLGVQTGYQIWKSVNPSGLPKLSAKNYPCTMVSEGGGGSQGGGGGGATHAGIARNQN
jgi:hypothetical protein